MVCTLGRLITHCSLARVRKYILSTKCCLPSTSINTSAPFFDDTTQMSKGNWRIYLHQARAARRSTLYSGSANTVARKSKTLVSALWNKIMTNNDEVTGILVAILTMTSPDKVCMQKIMTLMTVNDIDIVWCYHLILALSLHFNELFVFCNIIFGAWSDEMTYLWWQFTLFQVFCKTFSCR